MSRIIIEYLLPILLPFAVYFAWRAYAVRRAEKAGAEPPDFTKGTLFWLTVIAFVLLVASLAYTALTTGTPPGTGVYHPPRLEGDRIIPGHFK
ncbi:MAG: hypothetical protein EXQ86_10475 [Rhodospirillales bacterium]|nr:hypothetical protein [Rhodospirillales bacterium]